ncbi:MAG: dTMP kinase, partial [Candidatus Cloacimonadota bacterium]|nr:dTMP kinase [Candidatus Cloacimonadota bacterium]
LIGKKDIEMLNEFATFEIVPDITFLIDLDHEKGLNRIDTKKIDRLESESFEFHQRVRKGFLKIAKENLDRFIVISGDKSIEEINEEVIKSIKNYMKGRKNDF